MDPGVCKYCGRVYSSASTLRQHEQRHKTTGPYSCCERVFFSQANLKRHRCHVHDETKGFVCGQCGASFAVNADLNRHKRRHTQTYKYTCDTCQMKFETRSALNDHKDKHDNAYKHRFEQCDKTFRYRANLRRHVRTAHEGQ